MSAPTSSSVNDLRHSFSPSEENFSMVLGGPLYQLLLRLRVVREPLDLLTRRIVAIAGIAWLPLLLLTVLTGKAIGGVKIPFLYDLETHVRFLLSLPLLVLAERVVHVRFRPIILQFIERDIVTGEQRIAFDQIIDSSLRLRNSVIAEIIVILLVITLGPISWRSQTAIESATWYANVVNGGLHLTIPGMYYRFVSVPLFQFILLRWYFRLFIWYRFLWKVSRLKLNLLPIHPDGAGGLGFLTGSAYALAPLLIAQSALVSGVVANRIFFEGAKLLSFKMEILGIIAFLMLLALGPMVVFVPILLACQRIGNRQYGVLASRYVNDFHDKWIKREKEPGEPLIGSADIQSLADLSNSFSIIRTMSPLPFGRRAVIQLVVVTILPLLPLTLTVIPFDQIVDHLLKTLL